jgi:hypothetical protein
VRLLSLEIDSVSAGDGATRAPRITLRQYDGGQDVLMCIGAFAVAEQRRLVD